MAISDYSGQVWLQGFNDVGELILGMPANDLVEIKGRDEKEYNSIVAKACGHTYNFSCRAKQDVWKVGGLYLLSNTKFELCGQDTPRMRYGISRMNALDHKEEASALRDLLYSQWAR